jgi:hypothetical protein
MGVAELLLPLVARGGGALSLDRLLRRAPVRPHSLHGV